MHVLDAGNQRGDLDRAVHELGHLQRRRCIGAGTGAYVAGGYVVAALDVLAQLRGCAGTAGAAGDGRLVVQRESAGALAVDHRHAVGLATGTLQVVLAAAGRGGDAAGDVADGEDFRAGLHVRKGGRQARGNGGGQRWPVDRERDGECRSGAETHRCRRRGARVRQRVAGGGDRQAGTAVEAGHLDVAHDGLQGVAAVLDLLGSLVELRTCLAGGDVQRAEPGQQRQADGDGDHQLDQGHARLAAGMCHGLDVGAGSHHVVVRLAIWISTLITRRRLVSPIESLPHVRLGLAVGIRPCQATLTR